MSSQVKAVSGKLSGERLGGRSCADASGAIVAIAISVASAIVVVGEMLGEMWMCRPEASGAIRAANRQRTERKNSEKMTICVFFVFCENPIQSSNVILVEFKCRVFKGKALKLKVL